jgi:hypothetical protein
MVMIKQTTLWRNKGGVYRCIGIGTNSVITFEPIHTEVGRVWARWFIFLPGCAEIPVASTLPAAGGGRRGSKGVGTRGLSRAHPCK